MKALFWNIRGLRGIGRRKQLVELCKQHSFHFICLQETIKDSYKARELDYLSRGMDMFWSWVASNGHSGDLLMGVDKDVVEVTQERKGSFQHFLDLRKVKDGFEWRLVNVYGPVQTEWKAEFLSELSDMIMHSHLPCLMGGDFNLIRRVEDKS